MGSATWWQRAHGDGDRDLCVAYVSMEFGVDEALPIYSGGLGVLAGDHLKAADELGVPIVGVGLLYRGGYFTQAIDEDGRQRSEEHTSGLQSRENLVCRLLLAKKKKNLKQAEPSTQENTTKNKTK